MMLQEFEALIGESIDAEDYRIIQLAYHHPVIKGKEDIARLYKAGGMALMKALAPAGEAQIELHNTTLHLNSIEEEKIRDIKDEFERKRQELSKQYRERFGFDGFQL